MDTPNELQQALAIVQRAGYITTPPGPRGKPVGREPVSCYYIRASTDKQELSPEQQRDKLREAIAADHNSPQITKEFEDFATTSKRRLVDRYKGLQLYRFLQEGDHLWITKFDRLGRTDYDSLQMLDEFAGRGVVLHVLNFFGYRFDLTRPEDRLVITVSIATAHYHRNNLSRDMKELHAFMRKTRGYYKLGRKLGERLDYSGAETKAVPWEYERRWANQCWKWYNTDGFSLPHIVALTREHNVKGPWGGKWSFGKVWFCTKGEQMPFPESNIALIAGPLPVWTRPTKRARRRCV